MKHSDPDARTFLRSVADHEFDARRSDRPTWAEYKQAGITWEQYIDARHEAYLAGMTTAQRIHRWWCWNWPGVVTVGVLLAAAAVVAWVEYW